MTREQIEAVRQETFAAWEAEDSESRQRAYERLLERIAATISEKASVVPLWAAQGLYDRAITIGEEVILQGKHERV
jgi:hypothetical protein